jgi:hypothetical protein
MPMCRALFGMERVLRGYRMPLFTGLLEVQPRSLCQHARSRGILGERLA